MIFIQRFMTRVCKHLQINIDIFLNCYLVQACQGRTTVVSTCHVIVSSLADQVFVLQEGEVVETGGPQELLQKPGVYRYLSKLEVSFPIVN